MQETEIKFLYDAGVGVVLAVLLAVAIVAAIRSKHAVLWVGCLFVGLVALVLANSNWRNFSHHGAMHSSIVYEILERGTPPDMPLVAGERIQYFYLFHLIVANLMRVIPLAPPWFFAVLNVAGLSGLVLTIDRIARQVSADRGYRVWVMSLVLLGFTSILSSPLGKAVEQFLGLPFDSRLDIFHKFTTTNNNQLGILLFAITFFALMQLVLGNKLGRNFLLLAVSYVAGGFFYPPLLPAVGLVAGVAVIQLAVLETPSRRSQAVGIVLVMLVGATVFFPWLRSLTANRTGSGTIRVMSLADAPRNAYILLALILVPLAVCFFYRRGLAVQRESNRSLWRFLILSTIAIQVAFVLAIGSHSADLVRKSLTVSQIPLSLIVAQSFYDMSRERRYVAVCLLTFLAIPIGYKVAPKVVFGWTVSDSATTVGRYYRHSDESQDELYSWLAAETPVDAMLIDSYLTVPLFARRQLYVATDYRRESGVLEKWGREMGLADGWSDRADKIMETTNGISRGDLDVRRAIVAEFLSEGPDPLDDTVVRQFKSTAGPRSVFIVARKAAVISRLTAATDHVRAMFHNEAGTVFVLKRANVGREL